MNSKLSRRDFLKLVKYLGITTAVSFTGTYYTMEFEPSWLEVSQVEIPLASLPKAFDGYCIVQVSDIHMGGWMDRSHLADIVEQILELKPDLIVATGDFVMGHRWDLGLEYAALEFVEVMKPLVQAHKVIAIMGNHDHWSDVSRVRTMLELAGILELKNDVHVIERDGAELYIAGLDDIYVNAHDMEAVEAKLPIGVQAILLAHEPDYAETSLLTRKFFLQISGHSHGGQVVLPLLGPLVLPEWGRKYPAGLYNLFGMWLYTNRGVGMTSPFIRFNCRPEITVFTLNGPE